MASSTARQNAAFGSRPARPVRKPPAARPLAAKPPRRLARAAEPKVRIPEPRAKPLSSRPVRHPSRAAEPEAKTHRPDRPRLERVLRGVSPKEDLRLVNVVPGKTMRRVHSEKTKVRDRLEEKALDKLEQASRRQFGGGEFARPKPGDPKWEPTSTIERAPGTTAADLNPRARGGPEHRRVNLGLATVDTTPATQALGAAVKEHVLSGHGLAAADFATHGVAPLVKNFGKDAVNLPMDSVKGMWETIVAINDLLGKGPNRTKRAEKILGGLDDGFLGQLILHGDPEAAAKAFKEHPLYSGLEVSGVYGAAGRVAGAAARSGALGGAARRAGSTAREALHAGRGTNVTREQSYSKNLFTALGQRAGERNAARRGLDPFDAHNLGFQKTRDVVSAMTGGATRPGVRGMLRQSGDEFASHAEGVRRMHRDQIRQAVREIAQVHFRGDKTVKKHRDLLIAGMENRLRPAHLREDLRRERDRYERVYEDEFEQMTPDARRANRRAVRTYNQALSDPDFLERPDNFFEAVQMLKDRSNEVSTELVGAGVLDEGQAVAAAERPRAVAEGARYNPESAPAPGQVAAHEARLEEVHPARQKAAKARRAHEKALRDHGQLMERERQAQDRLQESDPKAIEEALGQLDERHTDVVDREQKARLAVSRARTPEAREHYGRGLEEISAERERIEAMAAGLQDELKAIPERKIADQISQSEDRLRQSHEKVKEAREARRVAEVEAKKAVRQARKKKPKGQTIGLERGGRKLTTEDVVGEREAQGLTAPGFVTHRPDTRGSRAFFVNFMPGRKTVDQHKRTGESTRRGAHEQSYEALEESLSHGQGVVDAVRSWDRAVNQFGTRKSDGKMWTWDEAEHYAREINESRGGSTGREKLVPVRAMPGRYSPERMQMVMDMQGAGKQPEALRLFLEERVQKATEEPQDGRSRKADNVVLMPETLVARLKEHQLQGSGALARASSKVTQQFRKTVLPFSPKWFTGNIVEGVVRAGFAGVLPLYDGVQMARIVNELEKRSPEDAMAIKERLFGGLIFGTTDRTNVYRQGALRGTAFEMRARDAHPNNPGATWRAKIAYPATLPLRGLGELQRGLFGANKAFEKALQYHAAGKIARREIQEMTGSWRKAITFQRGAVEDLVEGLLGTPKQVRFAREMDEMLGKYQRFSPTMRRVTQNVAPFLPWYLNSLRFIMHTLPAKHPVKTALLANVQATFEKDWEQLYKDTPPGDLMQAPRTKDGGYLPVARYTPWGVWGDIPSKGIAPLFDPVLPQIASVYGIARYGKNFADRDIQLSPDTWVPHTEGRSGKPEATGWGRSLLATHALFESLVPLMAQARRLQEQGNTAYDDSLVLRPRSKPNTAGKAKPGVGSAANRVFNPARPTYLQQPARGAGAGIGPAPATTPEDRALERLDRLGEVEHQGLSDDVIDKALEKLGG